MGEISVFLHVIVLVGLPLALWYVNTRIQGYAGEIGKITAISKKLDDVVEQQELITKTTENVKSEIGHLAWSKKEAITVKREKLEVFLDLVFESLERMRNDAAKAYGAERVETEPLPVMLIPKLTTIQMLYLPELENERQTLVELIKQYEAVLEELSSGKVKVEEYNEKMKSTFVALGEAAKDVTIKSQEVIKDVFQIDKST